MSFFRGVSVDGWLVSTSEGRGGSASGRRLVPQGGSSHLSSVPSLKLFTPRAGASSRDLVSAPPPAASRLPSAPPPNYMGDADAVRKRFDEYAGGHEIPPAQADDLFAVLTTTRVVLLLDDSASMTTLVSTGGPSFNAPQVSRWLELSTLASTLVGVVASANPNGCDVHFLNRPGLAGVRDAQQLVPLFAAPPRGGTPLIGSLSSIFSTHSAEAAAGRRILVVIVTDGEPSDGSVHDLFQLLQRGRHPSFHISLAECNDNEEEMAYLDHWDKLLLNFDNSDSYRCVSRLSLPPPWRDTIVVAPHTTPPRRPTEWNSRASSARAATPSASRLWCARGWGAGATAQRWAAAVTRA